MTDLWERLQAIQAQGPEADDSYEAGEIRYFREQERRGELPYPMCCVEAAGYPIAFPDMAGKAAPIWKATYQNLAYPRSAQIFHCPHCGDSLPDLQKKAIPPPHLWKGDELGNRCENCGNRNRTCQCSFPESAFEPAIYDSGTLMASMALIYNQVDERTRLTLGVSRKDNHNDFGLPGGHIEPGETPEECMRREVLEETGLVVVDAHIIFEACDDRGNRARVYHVTNYEGEIHTKEAGVVAWLPAKRLTDETASFRRFNLAMFNRLGHDIR